MPHTYSLFSRLLILSASLVACSSDADIAKSPDTSSGGAGGGSQTCTAGETQTCVGMAACKGGQSCTAQGTWSACNCGAAGNGGSSGASGHGGTGGGVGGAAGHDGGAAGHGEGGAGGVPSGGAGHGGATAGSGGSGGNPTGGGTTPAGGGGSGSGGKGVGGSMGMGVGGASGSSGQTGIGGVGGLGAGGSGGGLGQGGGPGQGGGSGQGGLGGQAGAGAGQGGAGGSSMAGAGGGSGATGIASLPRCGNFDDLCNAAGPADPLCSQCMAILYPTKCDSTLGWTTACVAAAKANGPCGIEINGFCQTCTLPHTPCDSGVALDAKCSTCVADVCQSDPSCCSVGWGASCAAAAQSLSSCKPACGTAPPYDVTGGELRVAAELGAGTGYEDYLLDGGVIWALTLNGASSGRLLRVASPFGDAGPQNSPNRHFAMDASALFFPAGSAYSSIPKPSADLTTIPLSPSELLVVSGTNVVWSKGTTLLQSDTSQPTGTVIADVASFCSSFGSGGNCSQTVTSDLVVESGFAFWLVRNYKASVPDLILRAPLSGGSAEVFYTSAKDQIFLSQPEARRLYADGKGNVLLSEAKATGFQVLTFDAQSGQSGDLLDVPTMDAQYPAPVVESGVLYLAKSRRPGSSFAAPESYLRSYDSSGTGIDLVTTDPTHFALDNVVLVPGAIYFELQMYNVGLGPTIYRLAR